MNNNITYFFTRDGNKLLELKHYAPFLPAFNTFNIYVEPYAGSFGTLRGIHQELKDNDIKVHLNDLDLYLFNEWNWILTTDIKTVELVIDMMKTYLYRDMYISGNSEGKKIYSSIIFELKAEGIPDQILQGFKEAFTFMGMVKGMKDMDDFLPVRNLLKTCHLTRRDAIELFEEYKNNSNAFLFLDPPYLDTNVKHYGDSNRRADLGKALTDNSIHYIRMLEMLETAQCKIMAVINKTYLTSYLFKKFIRHEYGKIYQRTKSKAMHIILTNY